MRGNLLPVVRRQMARQLTPKVNAKWSINSYRLESGIFPSRFKVSPTAMRMADASAAPRLHQEGAKASFQPKLPKQTAALDACCGANRWFALSPWRGPIAGWRRSHTSAKRNRGRLSKPWDADCRRGDRASASVQHHVLVGRWIQLPKPFVDSLSSRAAWSRRV